MAKATWRLVTRTGRAERPQYTSDSSHPGPPLVPASASTISRRGASTPENWLEPGERLPYRRSTGVLSKGEYALWVPLWRAVKGRYRIFCKVRLQDVVCCPSDRADERRWFKKIRGYHVDFVICDPRTTQPLLVVEHDDRRHRQRLRRPRDEFKDAVLRAAGVPVYRVRAQQAYDPQELAANIDRLIVVSRSTGVS